VLLAALRDAGIDPAGSAWAPLVGDARVVAMRYLAAREEQHRIEAALAGVGVEWVWLKGYALAHSTYPRPALRPMVDVDLLVPPERADAAERAVRALGYVYATDAPPAFRGAERISHHRPALRAPSGTVVEIHTRLHPSERLLPAPYLDWFFTQTVETASAEARVRHLGPEAQLLHLVSHTILQHGEGDVHLQRYYDCHLLLSRTPQLDWREVIRVARELGWSFAVERLLTRSRDYFGTRVPDAVWVQLAEPSPASGAAAHATSHAIALSRSGVMRALSATLGSSRSWPFRLYLGLRVLVPSPGYMRWRYSATGWLLPLAYARRWLRIARKLLASRRSPS
jgi:hypothetical protein